MIFCITSSIALKAIQNFLGQEQLNTTIRFIVFDAFSANNFSEKDHAPNVIRARTGQEVEMIISRTWNNEDYVLNFDCFHVFSKDFLKNRYGRCVNFHPSLLPAYGGVNPVSWGLYNREVTWGCTWHIITDEIDSGPIITQKEFKINEHVSQFQLMTFCMLEGLKSLRYVIDYFSSSSNVNENRTNTSPSYYAGRISPIFNIKCIDDAFFFMRVLPFARNKKWRWSANLEQNKITALSHTEFFGDVRLRKKLSFDGHEFFFGTTNL